MRGQEYTVMNYLVWAVFAALFAGVVMVVASKLAAPVEPVFLKETETVFVSAYRAAQTSLGCECASSNGPIAYSPSFVLTREYVQNFLRQSGGSSPNITFHAGPGFRTDPRGTRITAVRNVSARLMVCCNPNRCDAYFNEFPPSKPCP